MAGGLCMESKSRKQCIPLYMCTKRYVFDELRPLSGAGGDWTAHKEREERLNSGHTVRQRSRDGMR